MLITFFFVLQIASGFLTVSFFDPEHRLPLLIRILFSAVIGMVLSGYFVLLFALFFHSLIYAIYAFALIVIVSFGAIYLKARLTIKDFLKKNTSTSFHVPISVYITALFVLLIASITVALEVQVLLPKFPFVESILVGWGDISLHLGIIERLAVADPFILEHPYLAGYPLTYPFLIDFFSAIYRKLGADMLTAFHIPAIFFSACSVFTLFAFFFKLINRKSIAILLVLFAVFGGGFGWFWLGEDIQIAYKEGGMENVADMLKLPPHEYTHLDNRTGGKPQGYDAPHNIVWMVPALSFLTHQRSFPVGISLGLIVLLGALYYKGSKQFWRYGVLAGLLPLAHGHTFMAFAILFAGIALGNLKEWREYLRFAAVTCVISIPSVMYIAGATGIGSGEETFFRPWWGWMTCFHSQHWFTCDKTSFVGVDTSVMWFWIKNFGLVFLAWALSLAILMAAFLWKYFKSTALIKWNNTYYFFVPSLLLFFLPNLILFQPWEFDNNKIFFWWWILAIGLIGCILSNVPYRILKYLILLVFCLTILPAGAVDVTARLMNFDSNHYSYVSQQEVVAAEWMRENFEPNAKIIGGKGANNFIPMLTGRPLSLGFEGWLWTEGVSYNSRIENLQAFARGNPSPVCSEGFEYVVADYSFFTDFPVNKELFYSTVSLIWDDNPDDPNSRKIYRINCPK